MFNSDKIKSVTAETFEQEVLQSPIPVVVDFWGITCGPCKMVAPAFETLAIDHSDELKFVSVCIEENKALVQSLGLRSAPTFRIYDKGQVVHQAIGIPMFSGLVAAVKSMRDTIPRVRESQRLNERNDAQPDVEITGTTDQQRVKELFDSLGIPYVEKRTSVREFEEKGVAHALKLEADADESGKVIGYNGFVSIYQFDRNGKFVSVGIWE